MNRYISSLNHEEQQNQIKEKLLVISYLSDYCIFFNWYPLK